MGLLHRLRRRYYPDAWWYRYLLRRLARTPEAPHPWQPPERRRDRWPPHWGINVEALAGPPRRQDVKLGDTPGHVMECTACWGTVGGPGRMRRPDPTIPTRRRWRGTGSGGPR